MGKKIQLTETELINLIEKMVKEYDKPAMASFQKQYGKKKGKSVYYATANKQKRNPETFKVKKLRRLFTEEFTTLAFMNVYCCLYNVSFFSNSRKGRIE